MNGSVGPSARVSAIQNQRETANMQANLTKIGGSKRRKYRGGATEVTLVPSPLSSPQGPGGTTNDVTTQSVSNILQSTENSKMDSKVSPVQPIPASQLASQSGGTNILKQGQPWVSCSSGGRKSSKGGRKSLNGGRKSSKGGRKSKKYKKAKKSKKSRKSKKNKK
jgi:hypothetical protein